MSDKITSFPTLQPLALQSNGSFSPAGTGGGVGNKKTGFANSFTGDLYSSRGRFGNGTNFWEISATEMKTANFVTGVSGCRISYDGDVEFNDGYFRGDITGASGTFTGTLSAATLLYGKTSFTDTVNAGYFISPLGLYVGSANDASKLKYTVATGDFDFIGNISGRSSITLAAAIDASGHFADDAINTANATILDGFTFGASGALQIGTYQNGVSGDLRLSPSGILARDINGATTFSINGTTGVAVLNGLVVGTNVGLGTAQDSSGVTTIIGNTVTTGYVNALNITAVNLDAATGTFSGSLTVGTALDTAVDANLPSDINLVGYWSFDEKNGLIAHDSSGNNNNGTLNGSMTDSDFVVGVSGTSLDFDGSNDYIDCGTGVNLQLRKPYTFSAWVNADTFNGNDCVISLYENSSNYIFLGINGGKWALLTIVGGVAKIIYSDAVAQASAWVHIAATVDSSGNMNLYINGAEQAGTDTTGNLSSTGTVYIGWLGYADPAFYFNGKIDEVRIYSTALTAKEVYALYKNPAGNKGVMVPIGRLTAGSIYSKQITLAIAAGTGDSYIAAGKSDFTNTENGFILGMDDSDSDKAKFYIGSSTQYLNWTGTALNLYGVDLTAGTIYGTDIYANTFRHLKNNIEFELGSLDGWSTSISAGTTIGTFASKQLSVELSSNSSETTWLQVEGFSINVGFSTITAINWDFNPSLEFSALLDIPKDLADVLVRLGQASVDNVPFFGWRFTRNDSAGTLRAETQYYDNSLHTGGVISFSTPDTWHRYRINVTMTSADHYTVKWYIDNVEKESHDIAVAIADSYYYFGIKAANHQINDQDEYANLLISNTLFQQDIEIA